MPRIQSTEEGAGQGGGGGGAERLEVGDGRWCVVEMSLLKIMPIVPCFKRLSI